MDGLEAHYVKLTEKDNNETEKKVSCKSFKV
jgi:hypothetical protein